MINDDQKYWIKTVNTRAKSMPLNAEGKLFGVSGLDELGNMHFEEYKSFEPNIPPKDRKVVAIDRLEGFIGVRNYIYKNKTNEQKFHVDASIVGAVLYASSIIEDFNPILLEHKKNIENIKSDLLSELLSKISLSEKVNKNIERVDPELNPPPISSNKQEETSKIEITPPSIKTLKKEDDKVHDLIKSNDVESGGRENDKTIELDSPQSNQQKTIEKNEAKKHASKHTIRVGYIFSILGGLLGIIIACIILFGKYDDESKDKGREILLLGIISIILQVVIMPENQ
jgi:hypothetical protein